MEQWLQNDIICLKYKKFLENHKPSDVMLFTKSDFKRLSYMYGIPTNTIYLFKVHTNDTVDYIPSNKHFYFRGEYLVDIRKNRQNY
jgi:hypothetical protein